MKSLTDWKTQIKCDEDEKITIKQKQITTFKTQDDERNMFPVNMRISTSKLLFQCNLTHSSIQITIKRQVRRKKKYEKTVESNQTK